MENYSVQQFNPTFDYKYFRNRAEFYFNSGHYSVAKNHIDELLENYSSTMNSEDFNLMCNIYIALNLEKTPKKLDNSSNLCQLFIP
jgi:outer membrane protein assembly factor BamD (BamD/ComL family)